MIENLTDWLLQSDEPWTRYRTLVDLLDRPEHDPEVKAARADMLAHPQVQALITEVATWPGYTLKRHNDARHPIYKFSTLADFGVRADDPGMAAAIGAVLAHQSPEGAFQSLINIPKTFGGTGEDMWTWIICDAPTLLYSLLGMGLGDDPRVQRAVDHLVGLADENGWRCKAAPELGKFKGPGRKADPCPIVNVYALKALSLVPDLLEGPAMRAGAEMLLSHWENRGGRKLFLFGIGTDFRKLKYPYVWYNLLHVLEVLSRFPFVHADPRFQEMVKTLTAQADEAGPESGKVLGKSLETPPAPVSGAAPTDGASPEPSRRTCPESSRRACPEPSRRNGHYTATSMYRAWKGWSFADKKTPSPWLTFLALRVQKRLGQKR